MPDQNNEQAEVDVPSAEEEEEQEDKWIRYRQIVSLVVKNWRFELGARFIRPGLFTLVVYPYRVQRSWLQTVLLEYLIPLLSSGFWSLCRAGEDPQIQIDCRFTNSITLCALRCTILLLLVNRAFLT